MPTVGALNQRVQIQRVSNTRDDMGGMIQSWATIATVWAEVKPISAGEQFRRQQIQASASHKVTIRYRNDLLPSDRIVWRNRTFQLKGEMNEDQRRRFSAWACEELQVAQTQVGA